MNRSHAGFAICSVVAGVVAAAHADKVYVEFEGTQGNMGRGVAVSLSGGLTFWDGSTSKTLWAGQRSMAVDGAHVRAYSAELCSRAGSGWHKEIGTDSALGDMKASVINNLFAAAESGAFAAREETVAFQAMLWEVVYDFDGSSESLDLHSGRLAFGMVDDATFDALKLVALGRSGGETKVSMLSSEAFGDHFRFDPDMRIIPLPSAAALAGAGLLGVAVRRRRG